MTDRAYAYLSVVGAGKADAITAKLGVAPSGSWSEGDAAPCVGYYPASGHGADFGAEVLRALAHAGVGLDLDFYFTDDEGHD